MYGLPPQLQTSCGRVHSVRGEPMQPKTITKTTWIAFSAALAAAMMDLLDATIASVAGPGHAGRPRRLLRRPPVDHRGLHAGDGRRAAHGRAAGRHVRPQADPADRRRRLHDRVRAVRGGPVRRAPDRLARAPGRARRGHAAPGLRPGPRSLPGRPDGQGLGRARPGVRPLRRARPDRGRPADRRRHLRHRLALDLPRQRAGRRVRAARRRPLPARGRAGRADAAAGRDRHVAGRRRRRAARLSAGAGP